MSAGGFVYRGASQCIVYGTSIKCPVCSKFVLPDDIECHLVMCLTKPRLSYNVRQPSAYQSSLDDENPPPPYHINVPTASELQYSF
uniref:RING-type E3 ubiquitin transferase n=1 Tax=Timema tahoe TaxID=61484 RepID=A0A7R9IKH1_9NEOP|nr:unnamed protein product [Timema tahoe]